MINVQKIPMAQVWSNKKQMKTVQQDVPKSGYT